MYKLAALLLTNRNSIHVKTSKNVEVLDGTSLWDHWARSGTGRRGNDAVQLADLHTPQEAAIARAHAAIGDAVNDEVDAGVKMSEEWGDDVELGGDRVVAVDDDDGEVRRPEEYEDNEDEEHGPRLLQGATKGPYRHRAAALHSCRHARQPPLGVVDPREDLHVSGHDDEQRDADTGEDEEESETVAVHPVPEALAGLHVERVSGPADVCGQIDEHPDHPRRQTHQPVRRPRVDSRVVEVVADVDEAVDADAADVEQWDDTRHDAQSGERGTHRPAAVEERRPHHRTCNTRHHGKVGPPPHLQHTSPWQRGPHHRTCNVNRSLQTTSHSVLTLAGQ